MRERSFSLRHVTFVVAFCSVIYELLLSEISSILLGGTFYRYMLTIGLYIFCLGLGSLYYERVKKLDKMKTFFEVEIALSLLGFLAPLIPLALESFLDGPSSRPIVAASIYCMIIWIGLLSGLELPLLMAMADEKEKGESIRILSIDFLATFLGIVTFPLILMKFLGLFHTSLFAGLLNLGIFYYVSRFMQPAPQRILIAGTLLSLLFIACSIWGSGYLIQQVFG